MKFHSYFPDLFFDGGNFFRYLTELLELGDTNITEEIIYKRKLICKAFVYWFPYLKNECPLLVLYLIRLT